MIQNNHGKIDRVMQSISRLNPFVPNANFLYPLKTSGNHKVFWCFQELEKGCIENK